MVYEVTVLTNKISPTSKPKKRPKNNAFSTNKKKKQTKFYFHSQTTQNHTLFLKQTSHKALFNFFALP